MKADSYFLQPLCWRCDTTVVLYLGYDKTHHILPNEGQLFPAPPEGFIPQKNGTSGDGKQEQLRWDPPAQGRRFHTIKFSGIFLEQISAYSSAHQAYLKRPWCLRKSSHSLALLITPSIATPAITFSTWIITCCLHFSLTPQKYLCWLQEHMLPQTSHRSNCKQASCRTFLNVYFVNHTCSNFILPENTVQPWGTGWVWCSLLWGGPLLWMAAVWKCIVEAQISLWTFLLGCRAPFELSHNCSDLVHTCSLLELWVGGTSGASPVQTWLSFILKTIEVNKGLSTGFFKLEGRPTFLHFKGHQNSIEYFQASVESPPYCCKARRVTCSASFFHKPSRHTFTVFIFFSLTQRKFRQIGRDKSQARNLEKILFSFPLPKLTFTQTLH